MTPATAREVVAAYLPYATERVVVICPQERGYASDATHVTFLDAAGIGEILADVGVRVERAYSFPFPRLMGRAFTYNETVVLGRISPAEHV